MLARQEARLPSHPGADAQHDRDGPPHRYLGKSQPPTANRGRLLHQQSVGARRLGRSPNLCHHPGWLRGEPLCGHAVQAFLFASPTNGHLSLLHLDEHLRRHQRAQCVSVARASPAEQSTPYLWQAPTPPSSAKQNVKLGLPGPFLLHLKLIADDAPTFQEAMYRRIFKLFRSSAGHHIFLVL